MCVCGGVFQKLCNCLFDNLYTDGQLSFHTLKNDADFNLGII